MASLNSIITGLTILAKYDDKGLESHTVSAEHDSIFAGSIAATEAMSTDERKQLEALGWEWDNSIGRWEMSV